MYWVDSVMVSTLCVSGGFNVINVCTVDIYWLCVLQVWDIWNPDTGEHSFLYEIQSGNCEVCSLLCVCL